MVVEKTA